jgi:hypothetical protein
MSELTPCPECQRHVRTTEACCPFCDSTLSLSHVARPVLPRSRLGRAATFAFGATLASATALVGCGGESESKKEGGGSAGAGSAAGGSASGGSASGGSSGGGAAAGSSNAGNDTGGASSFGGVGLLYGAPAAGSGDFGGNVGVPPK